MRKHKYLKHLIGKFVVLLPGKSVEVDFETMQFIRHHLSERLMWELSPFKSRVKKSIKNDRI